MHQQDNVKMIMKMIPGSCIKELLLDQVKFSRVASRTVAKAINSLEIFSVVNNHDEQQITKTFKEMSKKTNLKKMVLLNTHLLKNVPTRVLCMGLNQLHNLCLWGSVTSEQIMKILNEMSHKTNLQSLGLLFPDAGEDSIISFPDDILTKAISKLKVFLAPQLKFSESQIKSVFQSIDSSKIEILDLGSCHKPQFSLVDQKSMISVLDKIKGSGFFKRLLQIKNLEMSIEELQRIQEENDKLEEKEKKLSAEEMSN